MAKVEIIKDDITMLEVDAIVNPANNYLMHGGGLAAEIVKRGGQVIQQESKKIGNVPTGSAVITSGGHLKAMHVIHAVGPKYKDGKSGEEEKLDSAVKAALNIATLKKLKTIALPAISSGIFGYPIEESAEVILKAVKSYLDENEETTLEKVIVCLFDDSSFDTFNKQHSKLFKEEDKPAKTKTAKAKTTASKSKTTKAKTTKASAEKKTGRSKVKQDYPKGKK
jgi:putative ATPase